MGAVCVGTADAGKSNGYSPGCRAFDDLSFGTSGKPTISWACCILVAV